MRMMVSYVTLTYCIYGYHWSISLHQRVMKLSKPVLALLVISGAIGTSQLFDSPALAGQTRFYCDTSGDMPVTKVSTPRGEEEMIRWKNAYGNGFTAAKRCQVVTQRLQMQTNRGRWFLTSRENVNGMPVICAVSREGGDCNASSILVTLPRGADPKAALQEFHSFRSSASNKPMELSGRQQGSYTTTVDGNDYINLGQAVADLTSSQVDRSATPTSTEQPSDNSAPTGWRF